MVYILRNRSKTNMTFYLVTIKTSFSFISVSFFLTYDKIVIFYHFFFFSFPFFNYEFLQTKYLFTRMVCVHLYKEIVTCKYGGVSANGYL
ncbi:hypothetical protein EDC94DRAFT_160343 [Helicostylum pulchrum]|nr:hypothetical protein EDC94DRAFT_160343 [Helicostylum pulchrum]